MFGMSPHLLYSLALTFCLSTLSLCQLIISMSINFFIISGNDFDDNSAQYFAEAIVVSINRHIRFFVKRCIDILL